MVLEITMKLRIFRIRRVLEELNPDAVFLEQFHVQIRFRGGTGHINVCIQRFRDIEETTVTIPGDRKVLIAVKSSIDAEYIADLLDQIAIEFVKVFQLRSR